MYFLVKSKLDSGSVIHKVIYDEIMKPNSEAPDRSMYGTTLQVIPQQKYWIKLEVLQNDLADSDEKVSRIEIDGKNIGECNPTGGDFDCTFFNCAPDLLSNQISSENGRLKVKLTYQGHSKDCDCDKQTWRCKRENLDNSLTPMVAVARITLTPMGKEVDYWV